MKCLQKIHQGFSTVTEAAEEILTDVRVQPYSLLWDTPWPSLMCMWVIMEPETKNSCGSATSKGLFCLHKDLSQADQVKTCTVCLSSVPVLFTTIFLCQQLIWDLTLYGLSTSSSGSHWSSTRGKILDLFYSHTYLQETLSRTSQFIFIHIHLSATQRKFLFCRLHRKLKWKKSI